MPRHGAVWLDQRAGAGILSTEPDLNRADPSFAHDLAQLATEWRTLGSV
jgi:hypothetical protein